MDGPEKWVRSDGEVWSERLRIKRRWVVRRRFRRSYTRLSVGKGHWGLGPSSRKRCGVGLHVCVEGDGYVGFWAAVVDGEGEPPEKGVEVWGSATGLSRRGGIPLTWHCGQGRSSGASRPRCGRPPRGEWPLGRFLRLVSGRAACPRSWVLTLVARGLWRLWAWVQRATRRDVRPSCCWRPTLASVARSRTRGPV